MRQYVKAVAGFAVALGIIALFTWHVGWDSMVAALTHAQLRFLVPGLAVGFAGTLALGIAWWVAVRDTTGLDLVNGVRVFYVTFFANAVTPLGQFGGEPFIAYILSRDSETPIEETLGAVVTADVLNSVPFFTVSLAGILAFLVFFPMTNLIETLLKVIVALALIVMTGVALFFYREQKVLEIAGGFAARIRRIVLFFGMEDGIFGGVNRKNVVESGETFYTVLRTLASQKQTVRDVLIINHVFGLLGPIALWLIIRSLGHDVPFSALMFILPASMLAGYLPLPGGLGGIELAMTWLISSLTPVPATIAASAVLLFRVSTYWAGMLIGAFFASRLSVDVLADQYNGDV